MGVFAGLYIRKKQEYDAAMANLQRFVPAQAGDAVPARNLTQEQARDLVVHYWVNKVISFEDFPTCDKAGNVTSPKPGEKLKINLNDIGGVKFVANNKAARSWTQTGRLDLRTIVLIVRFAQYLHREWGATAIHWGGLGAGRTAGDRHVEGLAMDFHGAVTSAGEFNVWRDWGEKRVPKEIGGDSRGKWPATATRTSYRLAVDPLDLANFALNACAREFFADVYQYLTTQASHKSNEDTPRIGQRSAILHPDTPFPSYRPGHQDHIHTDIL